MKIETVRQACCFQDDQIGPLAMAFDVEPGCRLDEFLAAVERSGFLQFSSTHHEMSCRFAGAEVARVFSPHRLIRRKTEFVLDPETPIRSIGAGAVAEFVFDRVASTAGPDHRQSSGVPAPSMTPRGLRGWPWALLLIAGVLSTLAVIVGRVGN